MESCEVEEISSPLLPSLSLFMFTSVSGTSCLLSGESRGEATWRWCVGFEKAATPALSPNAFHSLAGSGLAMRVEHLNITYLNKL